MINNPEKKKYKEILNNDTRLLVVEMTLNERKKAPEIVNILRRCGHDVNVRFTLHYLPVYSPHLNGIEYVFHTCKRRVMRLRRERHDAALSALVEAAMTEKITPRMVASCLNHVYRILTFCLQGTTPRRF